MLENPLHNNEVTISRDKLLLTPSKVRRPLFITSPRSQKKKTTTPTKTQLKKKIKLLQ